MGNLYKTYKTGILKLGTEKLFYKILNKKDFNLELKGYKALSNHYPVPQLLSTNKISEDSYCMLFEREISVGIEKGLLVDLFANKKKLDKKFFKIIKLYQKVFKKTLTQTKNISCHIFFSDRVNNRLPKYYNQVFLNKKFNFSLNGGKIDLKLEDVVNELRKYFKRKTFYWSVISQCDPSGLNIASLPVIFDYTAGGNVPLMAEFASLFWHQLFHENYLALKYNPKAFNNHRAIYKKIDKVIMEGDKIVHIPMKLRMEFLEMYIKKVINPCFSKIGDYPDWFNDFKNFFVMRIIGVYNVSKMAKKDILLSLGYLSIFYYAKNIKKPEDLLELID